MRDARSQTNEHKEHHQEDENQSCAEMVYTRYNTGKPQQEEGYDLHLQMSDRPNRYASPLLVHEANGSPMVKATRPHVKKPTQPRNHSHSCTT